jgi:hypothetical protein
MMVAAGISVKLIVKLEEVVGRLLDKYAGT